MGPRRAVLTAKTEAFRAEVAAWRAAEAAATWFHGRPDAPADPDAGEPAEPGDGHPRLRGAPCMQAVPEHLAAGLTVRCGVRVDELRHADGRWIALTEGGAHLAADAVVLTPPAPRTLAMLGDSAVGGQLTDRLRSIGYAPCWAALVRPDGTPDLPAHGALRLTDHPLHFVTDNHRKGISAGPSVTLHASPARSRDLLDHPGDVVGQLLLQDAAPWLRGEVVRTHRWRWSMPRGTGPTDATLSTAHPGPLAVAGDALAGGRVEGAWTSGRAAAAAVAARL